MASSFPTYSARTGNIASSNTDTGRENDLHFYCDIDARTVGIPGGFTIGFCAGVLLGGHECFQPQRNVAIRVSREWVAKISDFFGHFFVLPRRYFGPVGASRPPRIWYLAA